MRPRAPRPGGQRPRARRASDAAAIGVRPATPADAPAILGLMRGLYAHDRLRFRPRAARQALLGLLRHPLRGRAFLVEAGGVPAGYFVITLGWSLEYLGLDAFVDEIYLDPAWRGRGLGLRAIRHAERTCRRLGVRALHLEVERANTRARRFYHRAGFEDHDRHLLTRWLR